MAVLGQHDPITHGMDFEIAPHGRIKLGSRIGTICLAECDANAVQIVCDGRPQRCNVGSSIPVNGVETYIRNPFASTIKGVIYGNLPINVTKANTAINIDYNSTLRFQATDKRAGVVGRRQAVVFMPKRGRMHFHATGFGSMNFAILPKAKAEYLAQLPAGVLADPFTFHGDQGLPNDNIIARVGSYTEAELAQWVVSTGWGQAPINLSQDSATGTITLDEETAAIAFYLEGSPLEVSIRAIDLGSWSPEWVN